MLIVEDEAKMAGGRADPQGLKREGMAADVAGNGEDALWMAGATSYDAIVLDLMLPGIDGFEVCPGNRPGALPGGFERKRARGVDQVPPLTATEGG